MSVILIKDSITLKKVLLSVEDTGYFKNDFSSPSMNSLFNEINLSTRYMNESVYEGILEDNIVYINIDTKSKIINMKNFFKLNDSYNGVMSDESIRNILHCHRENDLPSKLIYDSAGNLKHSHWYLNDNHYRINIKNPYLIIYDYTFPDMKQYNHRLSYNYPNNNNADSSTFYISEIFKRDTIQYSFMFEINNERHILDISLNELLNILQSMRGRITEDNLKDIEDLITEDEIKLLMMVFI